MLQFEELKLRLIAHEEELSNLADALGLEKMKNEIQDSTLTTNKNIFFIHFLKVLLLGALHVDLHSI